MERTPETVALMLRIADIIEQHPEQYNQWWYVGGCGRTHCIAGWGQRLTTPELSFGWRTWDRAREVFGLSQDEADKLFAHDWQPHEGLSVPDALRKIAGGATVEDVSA